MAHRVTFAEALCEHEDQARKLGAAVLLLENNRNELKEKEEELRHWTRWRRSRFFLQNIQRERQMILSNGLRLQSEKVRLEVELEKARSNVQFLARRGKIVNL